jgi:hypothetical protein
MEGNKFDGRMIFADIMFGLAMLLLLGCCLWIVHKAAG